MNEILKKLISSEDTIYISCLIKMQNIIHKNVLLEEIHLRKHGVKILSSSQTGLVKFLATRSEKEFTLKELCRHLGKSKSTLSVTVQNLVKKNLLSRRKEGKYIYISLKESSEEENMKINKALKAKDNNLIFKNLDQKDLHALHVVLEKIDLNMNNYLSEIQKIKE